MVNVYNSFLIINYDCSKIIKCIALSKVKNIEAYTEHNLMQIIYSYSN